MAKSYFFNGLQDSLAGTISQTFLNYLIDKLAACINKLCLISAVLFLILDYDCNLIGGDAISSSEHKMAGPVTLEPCITACLEFKKSNPAINGITIGRGGCFCEQNANAIYSRSNYKTCKLMEKLKNKTGTCGKLVITVKKFYFLVTNLCKK